MGIVSEKKFLTEAEKNTLKNIQKKTQALINELSGIGLIKNQNEKGPR